MSGGRGKSEKTSWVFREKENSRPVGAMKPHRISKRLRASRAFGAALVSAAALCARGSETIALNALEPGLAPVDNPLKGLAPYAGPHPGGFPHSLEFNYLPLSALATGEDRYDWAPLERLLNDVADRGHQTVFRVFLEYPGVKNAVPQFLLDHGVKVTRWQAGGAQPPVENETPDYANPLLQREVLRFIRALGGKYDGDPRVGYITAGLLGLWGEWHDWPRGELFADRDFQAGVLDAYEAAFKVTRVLVRYPAGDADHQHAPNARRRLGYHDDSFAWGTLDTGRPGDGWFFVPLLKAAGPAAIAKWTTQPIGGEIRPEAWGVVFDETPGRPEIQDFRRCVEATHATWLMDSGLFGKPPGRDRVARASEAVRRMGYEFQVTTAGVGEPSGGKVRVILQVINRGVAPFYYDWPVEFGFIGPDRTVRVAGQGKGKLIGFLPGETRLWDEELPVAALPPGPYKVALRAPNPLPKGHPIRLANRAQDADAPGWLTFGAVTIR